MIVKAEATIEDLMQDAYMKALDNLSSYKLGTNFKAWISKIARNLALNYYNKNKRMELIEDIDSIDHGEQSSPQLQYYLGFLDGMEKEIVIFHLILKMTFKEIFEIVDVPISTAFHMYKKAIAKIKKGIN